MISPSLWLEIRTLLVLALLFTLPGTALVAWSGLGRGWAWLSRLTLIIGLSVVFYPLLLVLTPFITWGRLSLGGLLALLALGAAAGFWRNAQPLRSTQGTQGYRPPTWRMDGLDAAAALVLLLTLGTRFWMAHAYPFPAWTDSLHHTLLTEITANQGRLPTTLEPYFPIPLTMYHLGLYALAAPVVWLAQVPAHTALLWTAQALNGLCGIGVYLILERQVGRLAALVGLAAAGLYATYPSFYVNWGRYTQLAGQVVLPIAWFMAYRAVADWSAGVDARRTRWAALAAALLSAGVFLFHYRVAVFYLLWLLPSLLMLLGWRPGWLRLRRWLVASTVIGILALLMLTPVIGQAINAYIAERAGVTGATVSNPVQAAVVRSVYFDLPLDAIFNLGLNRPLFYAVVVAGLIGILRRNRLVIGATIWLLLLYALGYTYLLRIAMLNLTNLSGVLILFYLPGAVILGAGVEEMVRLLPITRWRQAGRIAAGVALVIALYSVPIRLREVDPFRYFVTPADMRALLWMRQNTPTDALVAVNTTFWLPEAPHGTDAGYWIPYLAQRQMTAGVMLLNLAEPDYRNQIVELSHAVVAAAADPAAVPKLAELGVDYIYDGAWGNFSGPSFQAEQLATLPGVEIVYQDGPVAILRLEPEP